jgi:hypothetical protein
MNGRKKPSVALGTGAGLFGPVLGEQPTPVPVWPLERWHQWNQFTRAGLVPSRARDNWRGQWNGETVGR